MNIRIVMQMTDPAHSSHHFWLLILVSPLLAINTGHHVKVWACGLGNRIVRLLYGPIQYQLEHPAAAESPRLEGLHARPYKRLEILIPNS
jgi:hypothetical protein